jgi:hypothetical protein
MTPFISYWDKTESNEIKETPQKPKRLFQYVTPGTSTHDLKRFKDTTLFLNPTSQKLHESDNMSFASHRTRNTNIHDN